MRPAPNSSPLFGIMALLRSMCSKTCHAAEAASMVAAFHPGAQDVLVSGIGKFLVLSHKFSWFVCVFKILRSLLF